MITLLSAIRAALGASCGPLPPHRPITEADTLRREVAAMQRACESHRREREAAERANTGLRAERDALADAVRRHKAARRADGRYVRDLLRELVETRADRDAARATPPAAVARMQVFEVDLAGLRNDLAIARGDRDAAIDRWRVALGERDEARQALAAMREAVAGLPVHLRAAIALHTVGWRISGAIDAETTISGQTFRAGLWPSEARLPSPGTHWVQSAFWPRLPAFAEGEHPALAVIRRAVAGEVLPEARLARVTLSVPKPPRACDHDARVWTWPKDEPEAPAPAPTKPLRDWVRDALLADGYIQCPTGHPHRLAWRDLHSVRLHDDRLVASVDACGPDTVIPYRDAVRGRSALDRLLLQAVAAYDAANGGTP